MTRLLPILTAILIGLSTPLIAIPTQLHILLGGTATDLDPPDDPPPPEPPVVTGIEGYGSVTGGHESCPGSWSTYTVTSLANSGAGTLRDAVSADCRQVVFSVSGTITLTADWTMTTSYITIDCNTATTGITINNQGLYDISHTSSSGEVSDWIIQGCTWDGVDEENDDTGFTLRFHCVNGNALHRVAIVGNTFYRSGDGTVETWNGNTSSAVNACADFTVQDNIFLDIDRATGQGYGAVRWTMHRNLFTGNSWRQPLWGGGGDVGGTKHLDWVNNIVWGWGCLTGFGYGTQIRIANTAIFNLKLIKNIYATKSGCSGNGNGAIHHPSAPAHGAFTILYDSNDMPAAEVDDDNVGTTTATPAYAQTTEFATGDLCQEILVDNPVGPDTLTAAASAAITAARTQFGC